MKSFKTLIASLVALLSAVFVIAQDAQQAAPQVSVSTVQEIEEDFRAVPCRNRDRMQAVRTLFEKVGATAEQFSTQKHRLAENLVVTRRGRNDNEIVVLGAHYDLEEEGCGAIDNWSGLVAIAHVYRTIRNVDTAKTVLFVAFGNEERGRLGSRAMVDAIPKADLPKYCAVINIDSFGMTTPFAIRQISSKKLMRAAELEARAMKMPFQEVLIPNASSDSESFMARDVPAITLAGVAANWAEVLHTSRDQVKAVNMNSVYLGYRLALAMWAAADTAPCDAYKD